MVDVVLQGVWILYCINKDESDESLSLLAFRRQIIKEGLCKGRQIILEPFRNSKYLSRCLKKLEYKTNESGGGVKETNVE